MRAQAVSACDNGTQLVQWFQTHTYSLSRGGCMRLDLFGPVVLSQPHRLPYNLFG